MSNLKVNSKSSVLEHKRKHNLLADKMVEEFAKIPELVDAKIESDKEIISKIVVDSENHTTTFPKGIVPMVFYSDSYGDYLFFDYDSELVYDDTGSEFATISNDLGKIIVNHEIDDIDEKSDALVYCYMNISAGYNIGLNFYNLFKYVPTTQLYKHTITDVYEDNNADGQGNLEIISTSPKPIINSTELKTLMDSAIKITPIDINGDFDYLQLVFNSNFGVYNDGLVFDLAFRIQVSSVDTVEKI